MQAPNICTRNCGRSTSTNISLWIQNISPQHQPWACPLGYIQKRFPSNPVPAARGATLHHKVVVTGVGNIYGKRVERKPITAVWGQSPQRGPGAEPLVGGQEGEAPWSWKVLAKQRQNLCKGWWATLPTKNKCDPFVRGSGSAKSYSVGGVWYANEIEMCKKFSPDQRSVVPKNFIELTMCFLSYCRTCGLLESFSAKKQCVKNFRLHVKKWWWLSPPLFSKRQRITFRLLYAIAIPSVVSLPVVCLSVCRLWRWCTLLSRLKFSAICFHHTIAQGL